MQLLPVAFSSSFLSCQQLHTNSRCSRQAEVSRSLQCLCCFGALNQLDAMNDRYDRHRTPGSKVTHLFLPEGGLMIFWECLLQYWLYLFFLYEQQHKHDLCFLLFYRTKQVAALFLSHHSPTLRWLTLTFDWSHLRHHTRTLFRSRSVSHRWPAQIPFAKWLSVQ